jgi:hypothetical protein
MDNSQSCQQRPACYGDLDTVFPMGPEGFREVPPDCAACSFRVDCLRQAVNQGKGFQEMGREMAKREQQATGGVGGFYRRWSRLKNLKKREQA